MTKQVSVGSSASSRDSLPKMMESENWTVNKILIFVDNTVECNNNNVDIDCCDSTYRHFQRQRMV